MRRILPALAVAAALTVAACSGGATADPSSAATEPPASAPASEPAASMADPCAPSTASGTVTAAIRDFSFSPATVSAKVGDVVAWTNEGNAPHTATLDEFPACDTGNLAGGDSGGIVFEAAGTYPFHCDVHPAMTGTIEVTE